jgi:hypothetical protein
MPVASVDMQDSMHQGSRLATPSASSLARKRSHLCFRDLPAELRNKIYDLLEADIKGYPRCIDLQDPSLKRPHTALPPLLQVSKQTCVEAGTYYFGVDNTCKHRPFDIFLDPKRLERFNQWLQLIGPANRMRLFDDHNVRIRLVQVSETVHSIRNAPRPLKRHYVAPQNVFVARPAPVAGLEASFEACTKLHPAIREWRFASTDLYLIENGGMTRSQILSQRLVQNLPLRDKDLAQFRLVMRGILATIEGTMMDERVISHPSSGADTEVSEGRSTEANSKGLYRSFFRLWKTRVRQN